MIWKNIMEKIRLEKKANKFYKFKTSRIKKCNICFKELKNSWVWN